MGSTYNIKGFEKKENRHISFTYIDTQPFFSVYQSRRKKLEIEITPSETQTIVIFQIDTIEEMDNYDEYKAETYWMNTIAFLLDDLVDQKIFEEFYNHERLALKINDIKHCRDQAFKTWNYLFYGTLFFTTIGFYLISIVFPSSGDMISRIVICSLLVIIGFGYVRNEMIKLYPSAIKEIEIKMGFT